MRLAQLTVLGAAAFLLSSCSLILIVCLTNAAAQDILITQSAAPEPVAKVIEAGKTLELPALMNGAFTVQRAGKAHWYQLHDDAHRLGVIEGVSLFQKRVLVASYGEDGCIYVVPDKHDSAVQPHAVQPTGFPLCEGREFIKPRSRRY